MGLERREGKHGKKALKQARKISDEEIVQWLGDVELSNHFLYCLGGFTSVHLWHPQNGEMELTIDNEPLAMALKDYLERHGVPRITCDEELAELAQKNSWHNFPNKSQDSKPDRIEQ